MYDETKTFQTDMSLYEDEPYLSYQMPDGSTMEFYRRKDDPYCSLPVLKVGDERRVFNLTARLEAGMAKGEISKK